MLSNVFQVGGFGLIVTAIYWLAGRPAAFIAAGVVLVFLGVATEGVNLAVRKRLSRGLARLSAAAAVPLQDDPDDDGDDPDDDLWGDNDQ